MYARLVTYVGRVNEPKQKAAPSVLVNLLISTTHNCLPGVDHDVADSVTSIAVTTTADIPDSPAVRGFPLFPVASVARVVKSHQLLRLPSDNVLYRAQGTIQNYL